MAASTGRGPRALSLRCSDTGQKSGPLHSPWVRQGLSRLGLVAHTGTFRPRYSGFSAVGVPSKVPGGEPCSGGSWSQ